MPNADFDTEVDRLATRLAQGPTAAFAQPKRAFNGTTSANLESAVARERDGQSALFETADFAEGAAAFRAKRPPESCGS